MCRKIIYLYTPLKSIWLIQNLKGTSHFFNHFFFLDIIVSEKKIELWNEYFSVIGSFFFKKNKLSRNFYYVIHTSKGLRINI